MRRALAHLYHREKMNETLMYNAYFLHRSYFEDLYDAAHPCANELIPFDPEKARALLAEAGWKADPATGLLAKDGQPLRLRYLSRGSTDDKFTAIFQEDLKDVGIELVVDKKDWAAWAKDMDAYNFDLTWAAWSAGLFKNPESMWASKEADRPSGQNITGYKNPEVDALIDAQRTEFDVQKRHDDRAEDRRDPGAGDSVRPALEHELTRACCGGTSSACPTPRSANTATNAPRMPIGGTTPTPPPTSPTP